MNDPHLLGMAFGAFGLYCLVRDPESPAWLRASAVAFAVSLFTKQSVIAIPIAAAIYLLQTSRRRFFTWITAAAASSVVLLALTFVIGGSHFVEHFGLPRSYSLM